MGGKSGGGYDAGPMIEYGNKALKLQEQMYDDSVVRTQPYYDTGTNALGMLADLLGVQGGSNKSRSQIYDDLMPQYTTENTTTNGMYVTPDGRLVTLDGAIEDFMATGRKGTGGAGAQMYNARRRGGEEAVIDLIARRGYNPYSTNSTTTDYDALNAAVDEQFNAQGTPDNYGSLLETFDLDKFHADPGYQFRMDEGQKAIERAAAARGQYYDPSTVKALNDYSSNMADQTYGDAYNRFNNDQTNIFNRLATIAGIGQTANSSLNQSGQNYGDQASSIYGSMGSAVTEANAANASSPSMFDTLLGAGAQLGGAYLSNPAIFMSDIRAKENIEHVGERNGYPVYEFNYKNDNQRYRGVMAQDVEKITPEAIIDRNGVLMVDYNMIGFEMEAV